MIRRSMKNPSGQETGGASFNSTPSKRHPRLLRQGGKNFKTFLRNIEDIIRATLEVMLLVLVYVVLFVTGAVGGVYFLLYTLHLHTAA